MSVSLLPRETIDAIIDYLHGDPQTLSASALISRAWYPRTRRYLFRALVITPRNYAPLLSLPAADARALLAHTRSVKLRHDLQSKGEAAALVQFLRNLLAHAPVKSVALHFAIPELAEVVASSSNAIGIVDLSISARKLPLPNLFGLLAALPHLRSLELQVDTGADPPPSTPRAVSRYLRILKISTDASADTVLQWLLALEHGIPPLQQLAFTTLTLEPHPSLGSLLVALRPSLEVLCIDTRLFIDNLGHLTAHARLHTLTLLHSEFMLTQIHEAPVLGRALACATTLPALQVLSLHLPDSRYSPASSFAGELAWVDARLALKLHVAAARGRDTAAAAPDALAPPVGLNVHLGQGMTRAAGEGTVRGAMPLCHAAGVLTVLPAEGDGWA